jgi:hypothetical protein
LLFPGLVSGPDLNFRPPSWPRGRRRFVDEATLEAETFGFLQRSQDKREERYVD